MRPLPLLLPLIASLLQAASASPVEVSIARDTGVARWVRADAGTAGDLAPGRAASAPERVRSFLAGSGARFGVRDAERELALVGETVDALGFRHLEYRQFHRGVPVFAGVLRAHFDREGRLRAVHGTFVPDLDLDVRPRVSPEAARARALAWVASELDPGGPGALAEQPRLEVFRPGLGRGLPAEPPRLVWDVPVGNGGRVRGRVFVDATLGKAIEWLSEIQDDLARRAYSGVDQAPYDGIPDSWPADPDWVEGDPFPSGAFELDAALAATADVHGYFAALGRDSYDGAGHVLDLSWNHATGCPNASWNGRLASFCAGFPNHDVVAHEWAHAYTQYTHSLIYRWQSGALSESFSDVWGESLDQSAKLWGFHDTDEPPDRRADEACSAFQAVRLRVATPEPVARNYAVGLASFGAPAWVNPIRRLVRGEDGAGADPGDGCEPLLHPDRLTGRLVFLDRGGCPFQTQARHAQAAGAIGVVVGNTAASPDPERPPAMGCDPVFACDPAITIPAVSLARADADALRAVFPEYVGAAIQPGANSGADDSVRWLLGEDVRPFGVARDMWNPRCLGAPGRTSDPEYHCAASDAGGVHVNSGVPNHAFALLADGGTFNGRTVAGLGLARAAHVYWRAQTVYQVPTSDFEDHADALSAACDDLVGAPLPDPRGGPEVTLTAFHCAQLAEAIAAVELRAPVPCDFEPMLRPAPPPACATDDGYALGIWGFETGAQGWSASRRDVADPATFDARDWTRVGALPDGRPGQAFFAPDPRNGECATGNRGDDESGVLVLESPQLVIPVGRPARLTFDHYAATEKDWDGGNVKLRVADGAWALVPAEAFRFNAYPGPLFGTQLSSNPLAGEGAFHGTDEGSNSGSWGRSIVDLSALVAPGQPFRLRFEFGSDYCWGSTLGWWVDDVRLAVCADAGALFLDGFDTGDTARWSLAEP